MKVRMRMRITGTRNGKQWPRAGEVVELPDAEAAQYCDLGYCDPVAEKPTEKAEKAVTADDSEQRESTSESTPMKRRETTSEKRRDNPRGS